MIVPHVSAPSSLQDGDSDIQKYAYIRGGDKNEWGRGADRGMGGSGERKGQGSVGKEGSG